MAQRTEGLEKQGVPSATFLATMDDVRILFSRAAVTAAQESRGMGKGQRVRPLGLCKVSPCPWDRLTAQWECSLYCQRHRVLLAFLCRRKQNVLKS